MKLLFTQAYNNLTTIMNLTTGSRKGREKDSRSSLGQVLRYSALLGFLGSFQGPGARVSEGLRQESPHGDKGAQATSRRV